MSLYSKAFVRRLRKAERFPRWKGRRKQLPPGLWRAVAPLLFVIVPIPPAYAVMVMAVWGTLLMFGRMAHLQSTLEGKGELVPFYFLPVSDRFVFDHIQKTVLCRSLWLLADASALLFHTISFGDPWPGVLRILYGAPLFAGSVLGCGLLLFLFLPRFLAGWFWILSGAIGVLTFLENALWNTHHLITETALILIAVTPPGWAAQIGFGSGFGWSSVAALVAVLAIIGSIPWTREVAFRRFQFWPDDVPWISEAPDEETEAPLAPMPNVAETIESIDRGDAFSRPSTESLGWVDRFVFRWLTPREMDLFRFVIHPSTGWTSAYTWAMWGLLVMPLVVGLLRHWNEVLSWWGFGIIVVVSLSLMTPLLGDVSSILTLQAPIGTGKISPVALLPAGIREIRSVMQKVNFLRRVLAFPWYFWSTGVAMYMAGGCVTAAIRLALVLWLLSVVLQPAWFCLHVSYTSNDTRLGWFPAIFVLGLCIVAISAVVTLVLAFAPEWIVGIAGCVVVAVEAFALEAFYLRGYERKRFDLIVPRH